MALGRATVLLGGGRQLPEDKIDPAVGIKILKTKGDPVRQTIMRKLNLEFLITLRGRYTARSSQLLC